MPEPAEQTQAATAPEQQGAQDSGKTESVTLAQAKLEEMLREAHKKGAEEAQSKFTGKISQQGKRLSEYERQLEIAGLPQEERDRFAASESWRAVAVEARIRAEGLPQSSKRVLMATKSPEDFEAAITELKEDFKGFDARAFLSERTGNTPNAQAEAAGKKAEPATLNGMGRRVDAGVSLSDINFDPRGGHVKTLLKAQRESAGR